MEKNNKPDPEQIDRFIAKEQGKAIAKELDNATGHSQEGLKTGEVAVSTEGAATKSPQAKNSFYKGPDYPIWVGRDRIDMRKLSEKEAKAAIARHPRLAKYFQF